MRWTCDESNLAHVRAKTVLVIRPFQENSSRVTARIRAKLDETHVLGSTLQRFVARFRAKPDETDVLGPVSPMRAG